LALARRVLMLETAMRASQVTLLAVLAIGTTSSANAAEEENSRLKTMRSPVAAEGSAGIGTPLGWLGAEAVFRISSFTDFHGGIGLGTEGIQVGAGIRALAPLSRYSALTFGGAWSSGSFVAVAPQPALLGLPEMNKQSPPMRYFGRAHFVNLDVGVETSASSYRVRPFIGLGMVVNPGDGVLVNATCDTRSCPMNHLILVPYVGAAVALPIL
jgi:hypothetical protein